MAFEQATADLICRRIEMGWSLRSACAEEGMPDAATVLRWTKDERFPEFAQQYAEARARQYEALADEILEISDDVARDTKVVKNGDGTEREQADTEWISRSKLRVDSRKWILSKMLPKVYGDKLDLSHSGSIKVIEATELTTPEERAAAWTKP